MDKREVCITIRGLQRVDNQENTIELFTVGDLSEQDGSLYLSYDESEATGFEGSRTTLRIQDSSCVTMNRTGVARTQLIVEKGKRHQCVYDTGCGDMFIGVLGNYISSTMTNKGGKLDFKYSLDINTSLASENEVSIDVREM